MRSRSTRCSRPAGTRSSCACASAAAECASGSRPTPSRRAPTRRSRAHSRRRASRARPSAADVRARARRLGGRRMTNVLAAIDPDACARPVLATARASPSCSMPPPSALHVREDAQRAPERLAGAAGVELRETSGAPNREDRGGRDEPDVAALVLGARGVHGGPQPAGRTALEVITRVAKPVVVVPPARAAARAVHPHARAARRDQRELQALDETIELAHRRRARDPRAPRPLSGDRARVLRPRAHHATRAWEREFLARYVAPRTTAAGCPPPRRPRRRHRRGRPRDADADLIVLAWSQSLGPGRARVVSETLARSTSRCCSCPSTEPAPASTLPPSSEGGGGGCDARRMGGRIGGRAF